jgi:putative protease
MGGKTKKIELLAPAGNLETALAAFESGADAVYAGLEKFNARERSDNFSIDDMSRLIAYAGKNGKKVYVTLNTLIKESELGEMVEYLAQLARLNPDAIIVQDIGVLRLAREYFPSLTLHASTQMGVHNSAGIAVLERMGVKRVILERQVTLDELREMRAKTTMEVEVFAHGALCCSLSGTCLFSSWIGGWSGNRGKCKQPCRRRYYSQKGNGFFFSPGDLALLEQLRAMREMNITSLKIEGRLKNSDYVRNVTSAYRMLLDADGKDPDLLSKARNVLSKSLGRKWTEGFTSVKSMKELIQYKSLGVSGLLTGKVVDKHPDGFVVSVSKRIYSGDRLRIQPESGDEGPAITVINLRVDGRWCKKAGKGEYCFIKSDIEVPINALVYKIGESHGKEVSTAALPEPRIPIDLDININAEGIKVKILSTTPPLVWEKTESIASADKRPLSADAVREEFKASRSDELCCGTAEVHIDGNLFLPASVLKQFRREFWDWALENIDPAQLDTTPFEPLQRFFDDYKAMIPAIISDPRETIEITSTGDKPGKKNIHVASPVYNIDKWADEAVLPSFCPEQRLSGLKSLIKQTYERGYRRFRVTSLFQLELLKDYKDLTLTASFPLPVCNSIAVKELESLGINRAQAWLELERVEIEATVAKSVLPLEVYRYGRPVLLATRADVAIDGMIKDQRGNEFRVIHGKDGISRVYPKVAMSIPRIKNTLDFYDLTNARWNETDTSQFNFELGWS